MLPENAKNALNGWIKAATPIIEKMTGQSDISWPDARASYVDDLDKLFPAPEGVSFRHVDLGGVSTMLVTPDNVIEGRVLFYVHGGGYVHGGVKAYRGLAGHYAKQLRAQVYVPDYRQAPEYPFPLPIDDTFNAYRALLEQGGGPSHLSHFR